VRGGLRKGAGRPPKPLTEKRRHRVAIYLTDAEHEALTVWARTSPSESPAAFVRRAVRDAIGDLEGGD
jgi:hypothetical protein